MNLLSKIVGKSKIDRIRNQQLRKSYCIQLINERVKRRREWDEHVTRMDVERSGQGTICLPEEGLQDVLKQDGAT